MSLVDTLCLHWCLTACHAGCKELCKVTCFLSYELTPSLQQWCHIPGSSVCRQLQSGASVRHHLKTHGLTFLMGPCEHSAGHVTIPKLFVCLSMMPNVKEKREFLPELCHLGGPTQHCWAPGKRCFLVEEEPCFGIVKTGTDFIHAHCLTCLQQGYLASSIRADAELPQV